MSSARTKRPGNSNERKSYRMKIPKLLLIPIACFGLLRTALAVAPPPDGCYPGFTTAEGCNALQSLTTGAGNTGVGWYSLFLNTTGSFNTALGAGALVLNNGDSNTATGAAALLLNTSGTENTAIGTDAMVYNDTGSDNTALGAFALFSNTATNNNTATGAAALANNTGSANTATGAGALENNVTGFGNTALGFHAGVNVTTAAHVICIGSVGANVSTSCFIENIRGTTTANNDAIPVLIDSFGQLGTMSSSRRFKDEIKPMDKASEAILALKPVTFHYKSDKSNRPEFGLIAEDVAEVNPDLVVCDKEGEIYSVRYDAVNAMLLNEFLKEHRTVQEQQASIAGLKSTAEKQEATIVQLESRVAQQQREMEAVTAHLKQQAAQIQNVTDEVRMSKAASQLASN